MKDILLSDQTLFRNDEVFNPDYVPEEFLFRDAQIREMSFALKPALRGGRPSNAFIAGPPSTGKTTATRLIFEELKGSSGRVLAVHVNCHMQQSAYKIFAEIYRKLFGMAPPDTGVPITKLQDEIFSRLAEKKRTLIVALDDVNYLFGSGIANDVLYTILRAHESFPGVISSIFAISTEDLTYKLDDRVRSIFSPVKITFPEYTNDEIRQILSDRVKIGIYPDVMSGMIVQRIAEHSGDIRFGIELLKQTVTEAEKDASKKVGGEHFERALKSMFERKPDANSWLLEMIRSKGPIESGELFSFVRKKQDISYTTFYRMLQKMKSMNLIEVRPVDKDQGKTSLIRAL